MATRTSVRAASCARSMLTGAGLVFGLFITASARAQDAAPAAPPAEAAPAEAPPTAPAAEAAPPAAGDAYAAETAAPATEPGAAPAPEKPKPPPYSLPWQLRPVVVGNVVRSDTVFASYEAPKGAPNAGEKGFTIASMLLASYKITPEFAPLVRIGVVSSSPPESAAATAPKSAFNFINPVVGATYAPQLSPNFKLAAFLGLSVPIGMGGGKDPDKDNKAANGAGIWARSAMDNAMFAVDYFTVFPGIGAAYTGGGLTVQAEVTLLQLTKVRGPKEDDSPTADNDSKTNFTTGLHVGYFFIPMLSAGAEIRHQRWLSTPRNVKADTTDTLRDTTTVAIGPRLHFKLGEKSWLRPGIAVALPLDDPMKKSKYKLVQLDIPFAF